MHARQRSRLFHAIVVAGASLGTARCAATTVQIDAGQGDTVGDALVNGSDASDITPGSDMPSSADTSPGSDAPSIADTPSINDASDAPCPVCCPRTSAHPGFGDGGPCCVPVLQCQCDPWPCFV